MYAPLPMFIFIFSLHPQDPNSEDVPGVRADDEDAVPDAVLPLLERYPLNTTLGIGEPLTSDEIARECLPWCSLSRCPRVVLIICKGLVFLPLNLSPSLTPHSKHYDNWYMTFPNTQLLFLGASSHNQACCRKLPRTLVRYSLA